MSETRRDAPRRVCQDTPRLTQKQYNYWTINEKKALAEAIQAYGFGDIDKLASAVKTKTYGEVVMFMTRWKNRVKNQMNDTSGGAKGKENNVKSSKFGRQRETELSKSWVPLEFWANAAKNFIQAKHRPNNYSEILEDVLRTVANKEDHVDPTSANEPDFKAVYNYFASLLSGSMFPLQISLADSIVVVRLFHDLTSTVQTADWQEERKFIEGIKGPTELVCMKSEPGTSKKVCSVQPGPCGKNEMLLSDELFDRVFYHKKIQENLNPLCIPVKFLEEEQETLEKHFAQH